jgi:hypothetical protein
VEREGVEGVEGVDVVIAERLMTLYVYGKKAAEDQVAFPRIEGGGSYRARVVPGVGDRKRDRRDVGIFDKSAIRLDHLLLRRKRAEDP